MQSATNFSRMSEVNAPAKRDPESEPTSTKTDKRPVIGGLHLRSAAGAWLLFAVVLLMVGICVAVAGYWNCEPRRQTTHHVLPGRTSSEKLRLIGPVIMGVGLFIFICANTILYENRDREKHLQQGLEKMDQRSKTHRNSPSKRFSQIEANPNMHTLDWSEINIHCLEDEIGIPTLKCSSPSSDSYSSSQLNLETGSPGEHRNMETLTLPVIKLNDCLITSSDPEPPPLPERTYRNKIIVDNMTSSLRTL